MEKKSKSEGLDKIKSGEIDDELHEGGCVKDSYCSDCDCACPMNSDPELREEFLKMEI